MSVELFWRKLISLFFFAAQFSVELTYHHHPLSSVLFLDAFICTLLGFPFLGRGIVTISVSSLWGTIWCTRSNAKIKNSRNFTRVKLSSKFLPTKTLFLSFFYWSDKWFSLLARFLHFTLSLSLSPFPKAEASQSTSSPTPGTQLWCSNLWIAPRSARPRRSSAAAASDAARAFRQLLPLIGDRVILLLVSRFLQITPILLAWCENEVALRVYVWC